MPVMASLIVTKRAIADIHFYNSGSANAPDLELTKPLRFPNPVGRCDAMAMG